MKSNIIFSSGSDEWATPNDFFKNLNNSNVKVGCIQSLDQFEEKQFQKISSALNLKFKDYLPKSIAFKSPS